jgi:hypothetical protein
LGREGMPAFRVARCGHAISGPEGGCGVSVGIVPLACPARSDAPP